MYQPAEDSYLIKKHIKYYAKGLTLDIGTGSGILAKEASKYSKVIATDISDEALNYCKSKYKNITFIKSNLFQNIKQKFDIIAFNPPYLPKDRREDKESKLATTGGKRGDEIIIKFLRSVKDYLNKYGIILLVISSLTPRERILNLLKKSSMKHKILSSQKFFFESLEVWKISVK